MKCSHVKGDGHCGNETGKPCPPQWIRHQKFDPLVLRIFFEGVDVEKTGGLSSKDA